MSEAQSFEPFKGRTDTAPFELGFMNGLGIIDTDVGFALLGTALVRIVPQGFIGDIDDSVGLELDMGPLFSTQTYAAYSLHVRWDFNRDQDWTFYGLGGVTGHFGSGRSTVLPRFGIGALWRIDPVFAARAEISHEFIVAGISLDFM